MTNRFGFDLYPKGVVRDELGFDFPQEVDFRSVYKSGTVFCEEVRTPTQARRMTAMARLKRRSYGVERRC
jgi:pyruvate dehydrogenase (quinone)